MLSVILKVSFVYVLLNQNYGTICIILLLKVKRNYETFQQRFVFHFLYCSVAKLNITFFFFKTSVLWRAKSLKKKKREPPITYICLDRSELWVVTVVTHIHVFYIVYVRSTKKSVGQTIRDAPSSLNKVSYRNRIEHPVVL